MLYRLAAGLAAFTAIVGGAVYSQTSGHKFSIAKIAEGFGNSLAALISPENTGSAIYSLLSAGLGIYSLVLLFGSHEVTLAVCCLCCVQVSCSISQVSPARGESCQGGPNCPAHKRAHCSACL